MANHNLSWSSRPYDSDYRISDTDALAASVFDGESYTNQSLSPSDAPPLASDGHGDVDRDLYKAVVKGDWKAAKEIMDIKQYRDIYTVIITVFGDTILHIAAIKGHHEFVTQLLRYDPPSPEQLRVRNSRGNTAFCFAAISGSVELVRVMMSINPNLPNIAGSSDMKPIVMAALLGHANAVNILLADVYFQELTPEDRIDLLVNLIYNHLYDIALKILLRDESLAIAHTHGGRTALYALAKKVPKKSDTCLSIRRCVGSILQSLRYENIKDDPIKHELIKRLWDVISEKYADKIPALLTSHEPSLLFVAVKMGNYAFFETTMYCYPTLLFEVGEEKQTLYHVAVEYRQEKIFSSIYELDGIKHLLTSYTNPKNGYNILHYAAVLPSQETLNKVFGAALQMQRELIWFQEVEKIARNEYADMENNEGETPKAMFNRTHNELRTQGEKWMKDTANSCMLVATLVAAGVLQAAYQKPSNENKTLFLVFLISISISVVTSTSSALTFLAILTSTYAEEDFLVGLPLKLMVGLFSLSTSIITMLIGFTATINIIDNRRTWVWVSVAILACLTCVPYILRQLCLLVDVYHSTFTFRHNFRPKGAY